MNAKKRGRVVAAARERTDNQPRPGRPTALTAAFEKKFVNYLEDGVFPETAARACGITPATYYAWMKVGKEEEGEDGPMRVFRNRVISARAKAQAMHVQTIAKASRKGSVAAAQFYLERTDPARWGRQDKIKVENSVRQDDLLQLMRQMAGAVQDNIQDPKILMRIRAAWFAIVAQLYPEAIAEAVGGVDGPQLYPGEAAPVEASQSETPLGEDVA